MHRALTAWALAALLAGCQANNPYAAFGPATVPAPSKPTPLPYYSAAPGASSSADPSPPATGGTILSPIVGTESAGTRAKGTGNDLAGSAPAASSFAVPSDNEPIRIVENPAAIRTATAPATTAPTPPATAPAPTSPHTAPPAINRLRGFIQPAPSVLPASVAPATRTASGVVPASFLQPQASYAEVPRATSGWKAR